MSNKRFAGEGQIWVCGACGKTHKDRYGIDGDGSPGWDESCMLHAVLCSEVKKFNKDGLLTWVAVQEEAS